MDKSELRRYIREKKRVLTEAQIRCASHELARKFLQTDLYRDSKTIYLYLSYNQEVRTEEIFHQAIADGKAVAVPKIYGDTMRFLYITDLSQVAKGYSGIPEPIRDDPEATDPTALVLMPGLAFDPEGHRIGYGGGFYDRFLEDELDHPTVALCYDFQMLDRLETDPHDIPVDLVISQKIED